MGWFSLGLGTMQLVTPDGVNRLCGLPPGGARRRTQRVIGARELAAAGGLLSRSNGSRWMAARVGGDVMDLALLLRSLGSSSKRRRTTIATAAVVGVTALDLAGVPERHTTNGRTSMKTRAAITVRRSPDEVYAFWRDFTNLPRFMHHLESVETQDDRHSHWTARGPAGSSVEWDAIVTEDVPSSVIAWKSEGTTPVANAGMVEFHQAPAAQGTEIVVSLDVDVPGGSAGKLAAKLFGEEPGQQVRDDLRHVKQILETGEIVCSEANPEASQVKKFAKQRPAQPLTDRELTKVGGQR